MLQHTGSEVKNAEKVGLRLWGVALGMNHTASGSAPSRVRHSVSEWPLGWFVWNSMWSARGGLRGGDKGSHTLPGLVN